MPIEGRTVDRRYRHFLRVLASRMIGHSSLKPQ
jgi:hypothetical protein